MIFLIFASSCLAEPLRIGYIGALTGDAAAIGLEIEKSLEVAADLINSAGGINGRPIEIIAEDDGYDVKRALTAYQHLQSRINSRVIFVSTYGAQFALARRPESDNLLIIDTLDCNDDLAKISELHLCLSTRTESIGETFLGEISRQGGGAIGILYEEEAWFNYIVETLKRGSTGRIVTVTAPGNATDYRSELIRLKSMPIAHLIFLGNDSMGRAMLQARQLGIQAKFYSIAGVMSPGYRELAGPALEGTIVSSWLATESEKLKQFSAAFVARWHAPIQLDFVARPTADAAELVFDALKVVTKEGTSPKATTLARAIIEHQPLEGLSGVIKFDPDGAVRSIRESAFIYQAGKLIPPP